MWTNDIAYTFGGCVGLSGFFFWRAYIRSRCPAAFCRVVLNLQKSNRIMPRIPAFRFNAKHAFLTFAQCPVTKEVAMAVMIEKFADGLKAYLISEELHQDGSPHLHMLLSSSSKWDTLSCRFFDMEVDGVVYHPNVVSPKALNQCRAYIKKKGVFVESEAEEKEPSAWTKIVEDSVDALDFMAKVRAADPRNYVLQHERLEYYANKAFAPVTAPYVPPADQVFTLPMDLTDWIRDEFVSR